MDESRTLELVRLAQGGDREAFGLLVEEYERTVHAIVFRRLRNTAEAAEVTQDVFVQMLRKIGQLREPERFVGWLKRIAIRLSINRAVRRPRESHGEEDTLGAAGFAAPVPLEGILRNEQAGQVRSGLSKLRAMDRRTLEAFYFEGRSLQEMAADFRSPVGTIKRRLHTARNRLKDQLMKLAPAS
jgi:RNA polymerase sigma-70 factor (ECF subfamily)